MRLTLAYWFRQIRSVPPTLIIRAAPILVMWDRSYTQTFALDIESNYPSEESRSSWSRTGSWSWRCGGGITSCREISRVLTERGGFQVNHSTIHDFVKRRCQEPRPLNAGGQRIPNRAMVAAYFRIQRPAFWTFNAKPMTWIICTSWTHRSLSLQAR